MNFARAPFIVALLALSCDGSEGGPMIGDPTGVQLVVREVVRGLSSPLFLTAPANDERLFIVEQPGRIRIVSNGELLAAPFLDISAKVRSGGEQGLLSMVFHPQYAENRYFYVNYTDLDGHTQVERYQRSANPDLADPASATLIISVDQPFANHNGGQLAFGADGMLYIGMGDGGGGGDPRGNGQRLGTLLAKMLRLDVNAGSPYAVPATNPFVGQANSRPEIWALGLRNPWRFSFDDVEGRLYVADVGQSRIEEITVVDADEPGVNYGWNIMEGSLCYGSETCDRTGLRLPDIEYGHDDGCSVTGGYVYRGSIADLQGHYFYSDYCSGWLRSARVSPDGTVSDEREWDVGALGSVLSFGQDARRELYVLSQNGTVYVLQDER